MSILKDHQVAVQGTGSMVPMNRYEMAGSGLNGEDPPSGRPDVPNFSLLDSRRAIKNPPPEEEQKRPAPLTIAIVIIVIMILIGGIFFVGPAMSVKKTPVPDTTTTRETIPASTPARVIPVSTVTPVISNPANSIPPYGVWVRVSCPGSYTGKIKAGGLEVAINSSGTSFYQMPVHDTMIEGAVEKTDGSGQRLNVEIYNSGELVSTAATVKPYGMVDIHVTIGPVVLNYPTLAPRPAIDIVPTPDTSLVLQPVPATGVFVRVAYPGNFSGSFSAEGYGRTVNTSGVQLYQIPLRSGTITGFFGKSDGSVKNMVVQVFKDGTMVSYANTSVPRGVVEIHAKV